MAAPSVSAAGRRRGAGPTAKRSARALRALVLGGLLSGAPVQAGAQVENPVIPFRVVADMVVLLNPLRTAPASCMRLEAGELDITLQMVGARRHGAISYQFGGGADATNEAFTLLTHMVTRQLSILRVPVAAGSYCYSLTYKTTLAGDPDTAQVLTDEQQVRLQMMWVAPAAPQDSCPTLGTSAWPSAASGDLILERAQGIAVPCTALADDASGQAQSPAVLPAITGNPVSDP
jgi:hypothetical protein